MTPFTREIHIAAPMLADNIDTDQIIPSREMKSVSKDGLAEGLFAGARYTEIGGRTPNPDFVLNQPAYVGTRILLGGANFGCGSSREHAAWALAEYGVRAVVAPSFNPIFQGNCVRNGIVPVVLPARVIAALAKAVAVDPQRQQVEIDLEAMHLRAPDGALHAFDLPAESRDMLLHGLDAIDLTLRQKSAIDAFVSADRVKRGWAYPA